MTSPCLNPQSLEHRPSWPKASNSSLWRPNQPCIRFEIPWFHGVIWLKWPQKAKVTCLEQLWESPHISIPTKFKLFNTTCVTILLYGCESWVISKDMENKINASCYRVMLNIKRIDHVLNTTVYSMTNTVPLIHLVRHRQLKFLGHILRMSKEEPVRRYAMYILTIGKRRPGRARTPYLNYVQRLLGDNEGAMQEQQIVVFADDRRAWRNLVFACSAANGWW